MDAKIKLNASYIKMLAGSKQNIQNDEDYYDEDYDEDEEDDELYDDEEYYEDDYKEDDKVGWK